MYQIMEVRLTMATTTYLIKSFGVVSVAKFSAVVGIVWGILMGLMLLVGIGGLGSMTGYLGFGLGAGVVGMIVMIIMGAVCGFIFGAVMACVYNVVFGVIGGIEMDLEAKA